MKEQTYEEWEATYVGCQCPLCNHINEFWSKFPTASKEEQDELIKDSYKKLAG